VDELPAEPLAAAAAVALAAAITGDAMADAVDAAKLFDVDVDQFARVLALVAAHRLGRFERPQLAEPAAFEDTADAGRRNACFGGDLLAGPALAPQLGNAIDDRFGERTIQPMRPRAAIRQTSQTLLAIALEPFAHGPRADAYGCRNGLRRLPAFGQAHDPLSTVRRQTRILMKVHPAPPRFAKASTTSASPTGAGWTTYGKLTASAGLDAGLTDRYVAGRSHLRESASHAGLPIHLRYNEISVTY
jgi:hypothetical protein